MTQYDNSNRGVLFANDKKTKPTQPSLRGNMDIAGTDYWASAWRKVSKETGLPYISIAMQEKDVEDPETINAELHKIEDRKSDKAPNFSGVIKISDEEELPIVGWVRVNSKTGGNMISISIDQNASNESTGDKIDDGDIFFGMGNQTPEQAIPSDDDWDDQIPF